MATLPDSGYLTLLAAPVKRCTRPAIRFYTRGGKCLDHITMYNAQGGPGWPGIKLRLRVRNTSRLVDIPDCQIYLRRIEGPGGLLEWESTRLIWSIQANQEEWLTPKLMLRGTVGERYVDLCSVDEQRRYLQIMSERYLHGGHRFVDTGEYILHVQPIAPGRRHGREIRIRVAYDASAWQRTHVVDVLEE